MQLIIVAAGTGSRLQPLTLDMPKCLVELAGRTLLDWQLRAAAAAGITEILVVGGWQAEQLNGRLPVVVNPEYADTNMVHSLFCAADHFGDDVVVSYGDIVYEPWVLQRLLGSDADIAVVVDRDWRGYWERRFADPLSDAESLVVDDAGMLREIGEKVTDVEQIEAQYIGLLRFRGAGLAAASALFGRLGAESRKLYMTELLQRLIDGGTPVAAVSVDGGWVEVDSLSDLELAARLVEEGRMPSLTVA